MRLDNAACRLRLFEHLLDGGGKGEGGALRRLVAAFLGSENDPRPETGKGYELFMDLFGIVGVDAAQVLCEGREHVHVLLERRAEAVRPLHRGFEEIAHGVAPQGFLHILDEGQGKKENERSGAEYGCQHVSVTTERRKGKRHFFPPARARSTVSSR